MNILPMEFELVLLCPRCPKLSENVRTADTIDSSSVATFKISVKVSAGSACVLTRIVACRDHLRVCSTACPDCRPIPSLFRACC